MGEGHVRVTTEYGTATVWLDFPGEPVNALDRARLAGLDAALAAVAADPFADIVVLRSARPAGFCSGLRPAALASLARPGDRAAFAAFGQTVTDRLANLPQTTVAFLDGPVLGAGLELALACDHRLVLSRVTTHLGFAGAAPCLGGSARLPRLVGRRLAAELLTTGWTLSGRESVRAGLADHAFSERRGKIELRTFLDGLERRGPRPRERAELTGLAAERRAFAAASLPPLARPAPAPVLNPIPPFPDVVGLVSENPDAARFAAEVALRGGRVVVDGPMAGVMAGIAALRARGFVTPLEAEQAATRVTADTTFGRAGLVLTDGPIPAVGRRCVVGVLGGGGCFAPRPATPPPAPPPEGEGRTARQPGGEAVGREGHADQEPGSSPPSLLGKGAGGLGGSGLPATLVGKGSHAQSPDWGVVSAITAVAPLSGSSPPSFLGKGAGGLGRSGPRVLEVRLAPTPALLPSADTDPDAVAALAAWLTAFGRPPRVVAPPPAAARAAA